MAEKVFCTDCCWLDNIDLGCMHPENKRENPDWLHKGLEYNWRAWEKNKNNDCPLYEAKKFTRVNLTVYLQSMGGGRYTYTEEGVDAEYFHERCANIVVNGVYIDERCCWALPKEIIGIRVEKLSMTRQGE